MKHSNYFQSVLAALTVSLLVGCASYPIAKKYRKEAVAGLTAPMVQKDAQKYMGAVVIWGGVVVKVVNDSTGSRLTVIETPLDVEGYPIDPAYSRGRFIAFTAGFLDPEIYRKGRRVTLAGEITGVSTQKLGEGTYVYPQVMLSELRYWQYPSTYYYPYYYPYYGAGWYGDWGGEYIFDLHGRHEHRGHEGEHKR